MCNWTPRLWIQAGNIYARWSIYRPAFMNKHPSAMSFEFVREASALRSSTAEGTFTKFQEPPPP